MSVKLFVAVEEIAAVSGSTTPTLDKTSPRYVAPQISIAFKNSTKTVGYEYDSNEEMEADLKALVDAIADTAVTELFMFNKKAREEFAKHE